MVAFSIIIPTYRKPQLSSCLRSLCDETPGLKEVVLVFPYTDPPELPDGNFPFKVELHPVPPPFNKSKCLNEGLRHVLSEVVLTSDADILWTPRALRGLVESARRSGTFTYIHSVGESGGAMPSLSRKRYTYRIDLPSTIHIKADEPCPDSLTRPGYGLVAAPRDAWLDVGGYKDRLRGWGWEDRDLLMRAELLGYRPRSSESVTHISHGNELRHLPQVGMTPEHYRNRNIFRSLADIKRGRLRGPLSESPCPRKDETASFRILLDDEVSIPYASLLSR